MSRGPVVVVSGLPGAGKTTLAGQLPRARSAEVVCQVPVEVALQRYGGRQRHAAHLPMDEDTQQRILDAAPHIGPLGLGPHLDVDTSTPVVGDRLAWLVAWLGETR